MKIELGENNEILVDWGSGTLTSYWLVWDPERMTDSDLEAIRYRGLENRRLLRMLDVFARCLYDDLGLRVLGGNQILGELSQNQFEALLEK